MHMRTHTILRVHVLRILKTHKKNMRKGLIGSFANALVLRTERNDINLDLNLETKLSRGELGAITCARSSGMLGQYDY